MHEILEMPVDYCAKSFSCRNPDAQSCATSEQAARKDTDLNNCPSSYKMGHQSGLSLGGSGSSLGLIMQPAFDVASGDIGLSVS